MQALTHQDVPPEENPTGEALLDRFRPPFKFWVPASKVLVVGHSQEMEREIRGKAVLRDGIPVHRRMGGGGAVLLSPACVCVGLRFARIKGRTLHDYYEAGSDLIRRAVRAATGLELQPRGISDLACPSPDGIRKVVGCSLYMPRDFALYLASVLVNPDLGEMETYLAHPSKEPDYRGGRAHGDFIAGLASLAPAHSADPPLSPDRPLASHDLLAPLEAALDAGLKTPLDWPSGS